MSVCEFIKRPDSNNVIAVDKAEIEGDKRYKIKGSNTYIAIVNFKSSKNNLVVAERVDNNNGRNENFENLSHCTHTDQPERCTGHQNIDIEGDH